MKVIQSWEPKLVHWSHWPSHHKPCKNLGILCNWDVPNQDFYITWLNVTLLFELYHFAPHSLINLSILYWRLRELGFWLILIYPKYRNTISRRIFNLRCPYPEQNPRSIVLLPRGTLSDIMKTYIPNSTSLQKISLDGSAVSKGPFRSR